MRPYRAVACCWRTGADGGHEIMLVRSRRGRWTLPGGRVDPGETPVQAAVREAFEEAGVTGTVDPDPVLTLIVVKGPADLLRGGATRTPVFLIQVETEVPPEETWRRPAWMPLADADGALRTNRPWPRWRSSAVTASARAIAARSGPNGDRAGGATSG